MADPRQIQDLDIQVYTADWCPDCRRLDRWMAERGISFPKVDIAADPEAADRLELETGKRAIPFLLVNGRTWVRGYHKELPQRLDGELLVKEVLEAAAS
ncbi:MAG TPA: glutaredoxin family protein [Holophagaceae bacterium]|nr:glutaredoxin family protein [Holophagaceae bacterium]